MDLKGRDFLTLKDFTPEEIAYLLDLSAELKEKKKIYKIEFFLSIILICLFSSYYIHAAYDRDKSEEVSQMILTEIKDDNIKEYCDNIIREKSK